MPDTTTLAKFPASGKVTSSKNGFITFNPSGTSYELQLAVANYTGPLNTPIKCVIRVTARKVYTVPSGGNFIVPIFGPPKIVQGMVRAADDGSLVVQAGCPIHVELPMAETSIDLSDGSIAVGRMVNVVCLAGAKLELI